MGLLKTAALDRWVLGSSGTENRVKGVWQRYNRRCFSELGTRASQKFLHKCELLQVISTKALLSISPHLRAYCRNVHMCERLFSAYTSFLFHCFPEPWFYNPLLSSIPHVNAHHKDLAHMAVYGRISENCLSNNEWLTASKTRTDSHVRQIQSAEEANLCMPGRGAGARHLEGEQIA
jgi:hypothetical protein